MFLQPHEHQRRVAQSKARFKVIRAGRKGGKSALEIETLCYKAIVTASKLNLAKTTFLTGRKVIYVAPTQDQARKIVWEALKTRLAHIGTPNEQQLIMKVPNEDGETTTIYVGGYENKENYRGLTDVVHITFDEVDTLKDFFSAWREIFRPLFLDTAGTADFIGTPKKENPNLRRLEKEAENNPEWENFHFTSRDNPHIPFTEIDAMEKEYESDRTAYRQEVLAEYVDNAGSLFKYTALVDLFSNTISKNNEKYLVVDIADDGSDKTVFGFFHDQELYRMEMFDRLNTETIVAQIRDYAAQERIPYSHITVDAIGVGAGVASSSLLDGIVGFKSSYGAIRTDADPARLPNVHYRNDAPLITDYKNLRSQCVFSLAQLINDHKASVSVKDLRIKEKIIEELALYQDASKGDGKRMATQKEDIKALLGRSPDISDVLIMRQYFTIRDKMAPQQTEQLIALHNQLQNQFARNEKRVSMNSTK